MRSLSLFAPVSLAGLIAALTACGTEPPPPLPAGHPDNQAPAQPACTAHVVDVAPAADKLPVARATSIALRTDGPVDRDAKLVALDSDGVVAGELLIGPTGVELVPHRPLAAGPVSWEAIVCGAHLAGAFEVGALLRPLHDDALAAFAGRSYGLDLRGGAWQAPAAQEGLDLVLRSLFGGALVVTIDGIAPDRATVALGSGVIDAAGAVALDDAGSRFQATVVWKDNPYLAIALPPFSFAVDGRALTLASGTLVLGLTEAGGIEDARLTGELDARAFGEVAGRDACHLLQAYSEQACMPCASDGAPSCFPLALSGLQAD